MHQSEADQARAFAGEVTRLIEKFESDSSLADPQKAIDYLTLMRTEVLEFADNPADASLRRGIEAHITNFIDLTRKASHQAG
ncbi:hypothetical protein [Streptomyces sp. WM6378]|uniref:hypothetical protein n=1 Tax=Streptomyces sp. WM6378 TaxID=1415557 RepID=UPI0006AE448A|nr:hypothetical protein [Streptomyces sp. WM6378]KOU51848.1 hypothetical protein ADK54_08680 [Streptomyces sp. WM6378]